MSIFLRHSHNVKPERWGSEADIQYAIRKNSEKIYGVDPDTNCLIMPGFWGFPCLDFSGKQNHGTPYGGVAYHSGSLDFDGGDDYVEVTDNPLDITGSISISGWVYRKTNTVTHHIISKNALANTPFQIAMVATTNVLRSYTRGIAPETIDSTDTVSLNAWHNIVFVRDFSTVKVTFYIDGIQDSGGWQAYDPNDVAANDITAKIGCIGNLSGNFLNGPISEVRINNIALTAKQIALFYARPWDLYRRVGRTYYSVAAAPSVYIPQIMIF